MASNTPEYHLAELELARSAQDPRRILPDIPQDAKRILDIGCGAGQTLLACARDGRVAVGVDYDWEALRLGMNLKVPALLTRASGEMLPFQAAAFDFVFSRVALPYMNIPVALKEIARVLQPGGRIWISLHPTSMLSWGQALSHPRKTMFELYRLSNTIALHFTGRQFPYPLRRSRIESYQTEEGMRRVLRGTGFGDIATKCTRTHFIITARRET